MSFFIERKKIFLFLFLFIFVFSPLTILAQTGGGVGSGTGAQQQGKDFTTPTSDIGLGASSFAIKAAAVPLAIGSTLAFSIANLVLGVASYSFDLAVDIGIYGISDFAKSPGVAETWEIFRNLANVGIVFILVFIAMSTILNIKGYEGKQLLGRVIISAVLLNFSFLFGAIVVDISNQMSISVYNEIVNKTHVVQMTQEGGGSGSGASSQKKLKLGAYYQKVTTTAIGQVLLEDLDENTKNVSLATKAAMFLTGAAAGGVVGGAGGALAGGTTAVAGAEIKNIVDKSLVIAVANIMSALTSLILAVILFVGSFMIYGRLVAIVLLLIVSPIAFVSYILPNTQKINKDWWGSLVGQSFFLPVFLLFIYIGVKITEQLPDFLTSIDTSQTTVSGNGAKDWADMIKEMASTATGFIIIMGFFIGALSVARKMASQGHAAVGKISASVSSGVGAMTVGTAAWAGRRTIGGSAEILANSRLGQAIGSTRIGSYALQGMKGVAKSSFDARNSRIFKGVASATGVGDNDFGKAGGKDGFVGIKNAAIKRREGRAGNLDKELSPEQALELAGKNNNMNAILDTDSGIIKEKENISRLEKRIATEQKAGNVVAVAKYKSRLNDSHKALLIEEKRVKQTKAYLAAQKEVEKSMSAQAKYGTALGKSGKSIWHPNVGVDRAAAKKILKEKSETDKIIAALKESNKS